MVPDRTGVLDIEATGGVVGRNVEHHGALTPLLPLDRQIMQEAEVITPPRRGAHGHRGRHAPEPQLTPGGTQVVPQIFTDVWTRDVGSDRRNDTWSPENVLVDTVARMQQDLADIRAENRLLRTLRVLPPPPPPTESFSQTAVYSPPIYPATHNVPTMRPPDPFSMSDETSALTGPRSVHLPLSGRAAVAPPLRHPNHWKALLRQKPAGTVRNWSSRQTVPL